MRERWGVGLLAVPALALLGRDDSGEKRVIPDNAER